MRSVECTTWRHPVRCPFGSGWMIERHGYLGTWPSRRQAYDWLRGRVR